MLSMTEPEGRPEAIQTAMESYRWRQFTELATRAWRRQLLEKAVAENPPEVNLEELAEWEAGTATDIEKIDD